MDNLHYIRDWMTAKGVGIVELAKRLGVHRQTVYMSISKGGMTLTMLHRIAAALDVPAHLLLLPPDAALTQYTTGRTAGKTDREDTQDTHTATMTSCPVCGARLTLTACCGKKDASV